MGRPQRGATLIELVVAITIVSIAATTILATLSAVASRSADAMVQQQAISIAQAYLDEILQRWVVDPNGTPTYAGRSTWDLVDNYSGLTDTGAHDQFGNAISSLSSYNVSVSVAQTSGLGSITSPAARRVDVTGHALAQRQRHVVRLSDDLLIWAASDTRRNAA